MIISPYISICKTDLLTTYYYGYGRDSERKKLWRLEDTTDQLKNNNLTNIPKKFTGWKLESFKDSYMNKLGDGISLFKKNLLK